MQWNLERGKLKGLETIVVRGRRGRCCYLGQRQEWQVLRLEDKKRVATMVDVEEASTMPRGSLGFCIDGEVIAVSTRREREAVTEEEAKGGGGKTGRLGAREEVGAISGGGYGNRELVVASPKAPE
ncbi:hypothetical protein GW17_00054242 [Ensete ventricosum]|nr:hypothetical protein GW17_00054242 [Ensete ventricosum]